MSNERELVPMPVTGAEVDVARRLVLWAGRRLGRPDPLFVLRKREAMRREIRSRLTWPEGGREVPEILIVSLSQQAKYGETDRRILQMTPSPWLKFEVDSLDDRGIDVTQAIQTVEVRGKKAYAVQHDAPGATTVRVVGRIPYENIEHIDWDPDPAYSSPRFYVRYRWRGPIKKTFLREIPNAPDGYAYELHGIEYKGRHGSPWKRLKRRASDIQFNWETRRNSL